MYWTLTDLTTLSLAARDGEIGKIADVFFDEDQWLVRYVSVAAGSWLLGRKVLIVPQLFDEPRHDVGKISIDLTKEQIENCPDLNTEVQLTRGQEKSLYDYFGVAPYWTVSSSDARPESPRKIELSVEIPEHDDRPGFGRIDEQLSPVHGANEVIGYSIKATDGEIGQISGYLLEIKPEKWLIRWVIVDIGNWISGKNVLLSPFWFFDINWLERMASVKIPKEKVELSPPYTLDVEVDEKLEELLSDHYRCLTSALMGQIEGIA